MNKNSKIVVGFVLRLLTLRISKLKKYTYWPEQGCTGTNAFVQYDSGEWVKVADLNNILAEIKEEFK